MSASHARPAVFLDLNGTLVTPVTPAPLSDYRRIAGVAEAVARLCRAGFVCPVVTVQSQIAKGTFSEADFRRWFASFRQQLAAEGAMLDGPYVCPHRYAVACACKKADGRLYRTAADELGLDIRSSFVVGDTRDDMQAARHIGCRGVLVRTGWPVSGDLEPLASFVADEVVGAARWIVATIVTEPRRRTLIGSGQDTSG